MSDHSFPPAVRLHRPEEFRRVFDGKASAGDARILLFAQPNNQPLTRLGMSVSRKVGNAVRRNRWKRLLREAFRLERPSLPPGLDLVIVPRQGIEPDLESLRYSLPALVKRVQRKMASAGRGS